MDLEILKHPEDQKVKTIPNMIPHFKMTQCLFKRTPEGGDPISLNKFVKQCYLIKN